MGAILLYNSCLQSSHKPLQVVSVCLVYLRKQRTISMSSSGVTRVPHACTLHLCTACRFVSHTVLTHTQSDCVRYGAACAVAGGEHPAGPGPFQLLNPLRGGATWTCRSAAEHSTQPQLDCAGGQQQEQAEALSSFSQATAAVHSRNNSCQSVLVAAAAAAVAAVADANQ
jgi:hypothetical protein